jgi:hypothetical protein
MSIRDLARELYRMERLVDELTLNLESAGPGERPRLELERKQAIMERDRYRAIMESKKESPPHGKTYV